MSEPGVKSHYHAESSDAYCLKAARDVESNILIGGK
jgi:hypothetical protein